MLRGHTSVLLPPYFKLLMGGSMKTWHITQVFEEYEYYRVEAESEEEAREKVDNGEVELYNWDRKYQDMEAEVVIG